MANPQLEDGFTQIANEILERICAAGLNGQEISVMLLVARFSYGMLKQKCVAMPIDEIANYLEIDRSVVSRLLKNMEDKNLVTCVHKRRGRLPAEYSLQKDWSLWKCKRKRTWPRLFGKKEALTQGSLSCMHDATQDLPICNTKGPNLQHKPCEFATQRGQICNTDDRESRTSVQSAGPPIKDKEIKDKNPPNPKGERGGSVGDLDQPQEKDRRKKLAKALLAITGILPSAKDLNRVESVFRTQTPTGWAEATWRKHCRMVVDELLRAVVIEHQNGAPYATVYGIACSRSVSRLQADAYIPHHYEGDHDHDESA